MSKNVALTTICVLIVGGLMFVSASSRWASSQNSQFILNFTLGTMFSQVSLGAAWCALGPFPLIRRLPLACLWLAAVAIAVGFNISGYRGSHGFVILLTYGTGMLVHWTLVQIPLWCGVARYGLLLARLDHVDRFSDSRVQFGIRDVLLMTALIAITLAAGRLVLGGILGQGEFPKWKQLLGIVVDAASKAVVSVPLLTAVLLPHKALAATCGALLFTCFATIGEVLLLTLLFGPLPISTMDVFIHFLATNSIRCGWIVTVLGILRAAGFRLRWRACT